MNSIRRITIDGTPGITLPGDDRWYPIIAGGDNDSPPQDDNQPAGDQPADDNGDGEPSGVTITQDELDRLRAIEQEHDRARKAAGEADRRRRKEATERDRRAGEWQRVADNLERDRDDAYRERDDALQRAERAESKLVEYEQRTRVLAIAQRRSWRYPDDAFMYLSPEERSGDDRAIEVGLKRVERERDNVTGTSQASGLPINDRRANGSGNPNESFNAALRRAAGFP